MGVSQDAIYDFMIKMNLPRRSFSENNRILFQKKPLSFKIRENLTTEEEKLKIAGLMLYWAEGSLGENNHTVDLANSDPKMIRIFLLFLRIICGIDEKRLRVFLYCYANQNIDEVIDFWKKLTKIPVSQFSKPYIRTDYKMKHKRIMEYGLIHIRYSDKKLVVQIKKWIELISVQKIFG